MEKNPIRRLLLWPAVGAGIALAAIGGLSLPWHGARLETPPRLLAVARGAGALRAGSAAVNVDLPPGVPMGGFARLAWRSEGIRDPVTARALYLEVPGCRVAIASLEVLLVTEPLARRVEDRLADLRLDGLLVTATHTHAGPGGFWDDVLGEHAAVGPYDAQVLERLADRAAEAVRRAVAAAVPARLSTGSGSAAPLVWARSGGEVDGRVEVLRLEEPSGAPLAEAVVFAAHPTTLGKANRRISGDYVGRWLAAGRSGTRIFLQGAVGDQSAKVPDGDPATAPERYAAALEPFVAGVPLTAAPAPTPLAAATASVALPAPAFGALPRWLRRAAATVTWGHFPAAARVTAVRIGPVLLVGVPAEPTAEVAAGWRAATGGRAAIVSLAGGYDGYVDTAARTQEGAGEAVRSYFGPELAARLGAGVAAAARAAADRSP